MTRFSLLHPSRNRVGLAEQAIAEWKGKFSGDTALEYILSIDTDDGDIAGYRQVAERQTVRLIVHPNRSIVDAVNRAAQLATGDLFVVVSDDFGCPEQWDRAIAAAVGERHDAAVLVHDAGEGRIMTLPIVGRQLYERLGYVYYPEYFSMFCDDDLTQTAAALGKLIDARHLDFPHRHCSLGGNPFDATYARQDSNAAWWSGWRIFEKRKAAHFGLRPRSLGVLVAQLKIDLRYYARVGGSRVKRTLYRWRTAGAPHKPLC